MKTGKLIYMIMIISMLFLYACSDGGGGGSADEGGGPGTESTYTLSGTLTISSAGTIEGVTLTLGGASSGTATTNPNGIYSFTGLKNGTYTVTPSLAGYTFTPIGRNVTINGANATSISFTATGSDKAPGLTVEQVQNALYAVYGGIGYSKNPPQGNSIFYDVMVDNMNLIGFDLILKTISNDINSESKMILFMVNIIIPSSVKFEASGDGYTSTLTIDRKAGENGYYPFVMSLAVAFNGTGYTYDTGDTGKLFGTGQNSDLTAYLTGHFNQNIILHPQTLIIRTVKITAGNGLKTVEGGVTTSYNNWELDYNINYGESDPLWKEGDPVIPVNLGLIGSNNMISGDKLYPDKRDYTVGGSFTINDKKFSFADGFRYKQEQWDYKKNNKNVTYIMMSANGRVSVPGLEDYIGVSSLIDTSNPDTNGTIITNVFENSAWSTDWLSGNLKFTTSEGDTSVVFDKGSVRFADSWTVNDWKTALDPLK